jgi:hypothetical protein
MLLGNYLHVDPMRLDFVVGTEDRLATSPVVTDLDVFQTLTLRFAIGGGQRTIARFSCSVKVTSGRGAVGSGRIFSM